MKSVARPAVPIDYSPYAGRWIAIVRDRVAGVGRTADEARMAAKVSRPKDDPRVVFVPQDDKVNISSPFITTVKQLCAERDIRAWLVGGAVRDLLLGRDVHDWDVAVERDAIRLARATADRLQADVYVLDAELDMARVLVGDTMIDIARLRDADLDLDLAGRDFTVNAMAVDLAQPDRVIDHFNGQADLDEGILRAIGEPALTRDPVRMLRVVRQSASLAMAIDPQTAIWTKAHSALIVTASAERVRDELNKTLQEGAAADNLLLLDAFGLLPHLLPELNALKGVTQSLPHHWDVYEHTRRVVDALELLGTRWLGFDQSDEGALMLSVLPNFVWDSIYLNLAQYSDPLRAHLKAPFKELPARDPVDKIDHADAAQGGVVGTPIGAGSRWLLLKWTALLHDIGKPATKTVDNDRRTRFIGHEDLGARLAGERLRALRFSNDEIERVTGVIGGHMRPHWLAEAPLTRRAMYRFFRDAGDYGVDILLLSLADHLATHGPDTDLQRWVERLSLVSQMFDVYFSRNEEVVAPPPLVDGNDIMRELGLPPGKRIGVILEAIREAQASGEVTTREEARALARKVLESPTSEGDK
jgi:putative nucleotidyltransferase with HDIG domain